MTHWAKDVTELVGHTPLVELKRLTSGTAQTQQAAVLAKLEMFSPGGSIKDRPALQMICEAEAQALLRPGGIITAPTSGTTSTALTQIPAAPRSSSILTCPNSI